MIIVTGGAGFIGSNIVRALVNLEKKDILVVDDLTEGAKFVNLLGLDIVDYMDKDDFIASIIAGDDIGDIKAVFHQGACSSTTEWNGKFMLENNYQYSKDVLHFCLDRKIPFLYASSAAIYGSCDKNFIEASEYERPLNVYGYSKLLFDQYVRKIIPDADSQICGLRYFNVYGSGENHKGNMASVAFHLNNQINAGANPKLFSNSENFKRDFIHVDDVVAVNLWAWNNNISGIYNCGTGQAASFQTLANAVVEYHCNNKGKNPTVEYIDFPETLKNHYQKFTQADLSKLRAAGYDKTFKNVEQGVKEYMGWLNRPLWKP